MQDQAEHRTRALEELRTKNFCEIQRATALKWAWRSWAAMTLWRENPGATWRDDAIEYKHECIEHASLAGESDFATLKLVRRITEGLVSRRGIESDDQALQAARDELRSKSLSEIQKDTALTWAYRAWAGYQLKHVADAVDFEAQSLEHAALSGVDSVLEEVRGIVRGS
jgi:hypothetical protein